MHHALEIEELLLEIFNHCCPTALSGEQRKKYTPDLAALARTCRAFKEPALDVLWNVLISDLSPLARCLPDASCRLPPTTTYSFRRPLTDPEWYILHSYVRRIRHIRNFQYGLDRKTIKIPSDPPPGVTLFSNLRELQCTYTKKTKALLRHPLPSLVFLDVQFASLQLFRNSLDSLLKFSPNISKLSFSMDHLPVGMVDRQVEPNFISRWQNLRSVICPQLAFDVEALVHLSRMPALTQLSFTPSFSVQTFDSPLLFPNLHELILQSYALEPISRFLSRIRLSITSLAASINSCPSRQNLSSFMDSIRVSGAGHTIQRMTLTQTHSPVFPNYTAGPRSEYLLLGFEDLRPCMAFSNLRHLRLDIEWDVDLTDSTVLTLASAWPELHYLQINAKWGWNAWDGITPGGFVALLKLCRSLRQIALALDLRGFTEWSPVGPVLEGVERTSPESLFLFDVLDAAIERDSVQAVINFFSGVAAACPDFIFTFWSGHYMTRYTRSEGYYGQRWKEVYDGVWPGFGDTFE